MTDSLIETSSSYLEENTILISFIMIQPVVFTTLKCKLHRQTQHFDAIRHVSVHQNHHRALLFTKVYGPKYAGNIQKSLRFFKFVKKKVPDDGSDEPKCVVRCRMAYLLCISTLGIN
jgi:hypothetical protein